MLECDDVGGVRGRVDELDRFSESNLSISACEYAAPTTRLDSRVVFLGPFPGVELRQNGEADSDLSTWTISCCGGGFLPLPDEEEENILGAED